MQAALWVGCAALLLSACSNEPVQQAIAVHAASGLKALISSSGEVNYVMIGGSLLVTRQLDGMATGTCVSPNGKRCSEQLLAAGGYGSY